MNVMKCEMCQRPEGEIVNDEPLQLALIEVGNVKRQLCAWCHIFLMMFSTEPVEVGECGGLTFTSESGETRQLGAGTLYVQHTEDSPQS